MTKLCSHKMKGKGVYLNKVLCVSNIEVAPGQYCLPCNLREERMGEDRTMTLL